MQINISMLHIPVRSNDLCCSIYILSIKFLFYFIYFTHISIIYFTNRFLMDSLRFIIVLNSPTLAIMISNLIFLIPYFHLPNYVLATYNIFHLSNLFLFIHFCLDFDICQYRLHLHPFYSNSNPSFQSALPSCFVHFWQTMIGLLQYQKFEFQQQWIHIYIGYQEARK